MNIKIFLKKNKKDDWSSIIFSFIITDCECHAGKGRNTCHYKIANRIVFCLDEVTCMLMYAIINYVRFNKKKFKGKRRFNHFYMTLIISDDFASISITCLAE